MRKSVAVLEYGMGNIDSVIRAIEYCGGNPIVARTPEAVASASHIILPGVGAFNIGISNLRKQGLIEPLNEQVLAKGQPFLGICLGMQFLASVGHEGGLSDGLGWIPGEVVKIERVSVDQRIPHIGWNNLNIVKTQPLFDGISQEKDFYFVHSYHFACADAADVLAETDYFGRVVSAVGRNNIFGVQFHPEKSQKVGFQLLKNFLAM